MAFREIKIPPGSSNIRDVAYDADAGTLRVTFLRDPIPYTYYSVDEGTAHGFATSGLSAGQYFRANILNQYPFQKG